MSGFHTFLEVREAESPDSWVLIAPLIYETGAGEKIIIPRGFITDLASIPQALRSLIDVNGISRSPAVLHDYLYCLQDREREPVDALFVEALYSRGATRLQAETYYFGVRIGGQCGWDNRAGHGLVPGFDIVAVGYWEVTVRL
jgi:cytochrome oxidase assembly protein ShyY1